MPLELTEASFLRLLSVRVRYYINSQWAINDNIFFIFPGKFPIFYRRDYEATEVSITDNLFMLIWMPLDFLVKVIKIVVNKKVNTVFVSLRSRCSCYRKFNERKRVCYRLETCKTRQAAFCF